MTEFPLSLLRVLKGFLGVLELEYRGTKRRIYELWNDLDSRPTGHIASNKPLCSRLLKDNGLPVPEFVEVLSTDLNEALKKSSIFRDKIVIKPATGTSEARGVTAGIYKNDINI